MAEPNKSHDDRPSTEDTSLPDSAHNSEIVEAEVVEEVSTTPAPTASTPSASAPGESTPPGSQNDAEFQQYQQFLEFQKFQEWQRQQGGSTADGPPSPVRPGRRPWWHHILRTLRFKFVRRLLYLVLIFILIIILFNMALNYIFGGSDDTESHTGTPGNLDPGISPVLPSQPNEAMIGLYSTLANDPDLTCEAFDQPSSTAFARGNGASDCGSAAQQIHSRITAPSDYANPEFGEDAIVQLPTQATVSSCKTNVQGGPRLGKFRLQKQPNGGWLIDGYAPESCP